MAAADTLETKTDPKDTLANGSDEQAKKLREFADQADKLVRERTEELRRRAKEYYSEASDRIDVAHRYVAERVQEKPMTATFAAVGVGLVLGLLLAGSSRRR